MRKIEASNSDKYGGRNGQNNSNASRNGERESQPAATCIRKEEKKRRVASSTFKQRFVIYPDDSKPTQSQLAKVQTSKEHSAELTLNASMTEEDVRRLVIQHLPKLNDFSGRFRFATRDGHGNLYECPCKLKCNMHQPPEEWNGRNIRKAAKSNRCVYVLSERLAQVFFNRNVREGEETCHSAHNGSDKDSAYGSPKTEANQNSMDSTSAASNDEETEISPALPKSLKRVFTGELKTWENGHLPSSSIGGPTSSLSKKSRTVDPNSEPGDAANQIADCVGRKSSHTDTTFDSPLAETVPAQRNNAATECDDITTVYQRHSPHTSMELLENFNGDDVLSSPDSWLSGNDEPSQAHSTDSRESLLDNPRNVTQLLSSKSGDGNDRNTSGEEQQENTRSHQRKIVFIAPNKCDIKGGEPFLIVVCGGLSDCGPGSTNVQFDVGGPIVECEKISQDSLQGTVPARSAPGVVPVCVPVGPNVFESALFEYTDELDMKTILMNTKLTSKREFKELLTILVEKIEEMSLSSDEGKSGSGENNTENTKSQALSLLQMIVETAAKTNAMKFFDIVFRTSVGRCVFKSCKEESTALEEVARQNGHEELACFLEETHTKYRAVESDSDDEVDWQALAKAAEEYQKRNAGMVEVINERSSSSEGKDDYLGDAENSSCVSLGSLSVNNPSLEDEITEAVDSEQTETELGDLKQITTSRPQDKDVQTWIPFTALPSSSSLPVQVSPLFGRDWECREIVKNLCWENRGVVFLSGIPGIGKTAVGVHVGHELHSKGWIVQYESCRNFGNDQNSVLSFLCGPVHHGLDLDSCSVINNNQAMSAISANTIVILDDVEILLVADEQGVMRRKFKALVEAAARNSFVRLLFISCEKYSFLENLGFCINLGPLCGTAAVKLLESATEMISLTDPEKIAKICGYKPLVLLNVSRLLCEGKMSGEDVINMYSSSESNEDNTCDERYLDRHFTKLAEFLLKSVPLQTKTATCCSCDLEYCGNGEQADLDKKNVQNDFFLSGEDPGERLEKIVREGVQTKSPEESLKDSINEKLSDTASEWMIPPCKLNAHQSSVSPAVSPDFVTSCSETIDFSKQYDPSDPGDPPRSTQENVSGVSHLGRETFRKFPKVGGLRAREHKGSNAAATSIDFDESLSHDVKGHSLDTNETWLPSERLNIRRKGFRKRGLVWLLVLLLVTAAFSSGIALLLTRGEDTAMKTKYSNLSKDTLSPNEVNSAVAICAANQYKVLGSNESSWCTDCPSCPEGQEVYPECGSTVSTNDQSGCRPCQEGKTFSSMDDVWSCMSCGYCAEDQVVDQNCTKYSDKVCKKQCNSIDRYYDNKIGACMLCSSCCGDEEDIHVKECQQKLGDASGKVCAFHSNNSRCKKTTPTSVAEQTSSYTNEKNPANTTTHPPTKGITRVDTTTTAVHFIPPSDKVSSFHEDNQQTQSPKKQGVHVEATNKHDTVLPLVCTIIFGLLLLVTFFAGCCLLKGIRCHCGSQDTERLSKGNCGSSTSEPKVLFSNITSSDGSVYSQVFMKDEMKTQSPKKTRPLGKIGTTEGAETTIKKSERTPNTARKEGQESKELLLNKKGSETGDSLYQGHSFNADSKKLESLLDHGSVLLDDICLRLDTPVKGCGSYDEIAAHYGLDYFERKALEKSPEGPTKAMFVWLATAYPNLTIQDFIITVKMKTKRNDVVQLLEMYDNSMQ